MSIQEQEPPKETPVQEYIKVLIDSLCHTPPQLYTTEQAAADLEKAQPTLNPELYKKLERTLKLRDNVTGLLGRDALNDTLIEYLKEIASSPENLAKEARKVGLVTFDLRGLKVVNDSCKDHRFGDLFLKNTAEMCAKIFERIGNNIGAAVTISRDGGDEFSVLLKTESVDLDAVVLADDKERENPLHFRKIFSDYLPSAELVIAESRGKKLKLIDFLPKIFAAQLQRFSLDSIFLDEDELDRFKERMKEAENLFASSESEKKERAGQIRQEEREKARRKMKKVLEAHLNKSYDPESGLQPESIPEDFHFRALVAAGSTLLSDTIENPNENHFKKILPEPSGRDAAYALLGAMRSAADEKSYHVKAEQNKLWLVSEDPLVQTLLKLATRNDLTLALLLMKTKLEQSKKKLEERLGEQGRLHEWKDSERDFILHDIEELYNKLDDLNKQIDELTAQNENLRTDLHSCLTEKARLEANKHTP